MRRADRALPYQPPRRLDRAGAAELEEHRELQPALCRQRAEPGRVGGGERQRLFAQDVPAGVQRPLGDAGEQVVRGADIDGGDRRIGQHVLDAGGGAGAGAGGELPCPAAVRVGGGDDAEAQAGARAGDLARRPAAADDAEPDHGASGAGAPIRWESEP